MKDAKTVKVSAMSKSTSMDAKEPASLEVYADDKKHGVKYLVLTCLTIFIQTLHDVCLDAKIVCL